MLLFLYVFDPTERISNSSYSYSVIVTIKVADHNFASSLLWIVLLVRCSILISFHRVGLTTARLPICKDCGVEAVNYFLDQAWYL